VLRTEGVTSGNAADDGADRRGWLVGHFLTGGDGPRATGDVEVKWAVYDGGEVRPDWGVNDRAHTLALLVRGVFRLRFPEREVLLSQEGDYVLWEPGVPHLWQAETPAVVVTVRWPSVPGDSRDVGAGRGRQ
jgi:hypothetical protein